MAGNALARAIESEFAEQWQAARAAWRRGQPELDPHLREPGADPRLGLSLIAWPSASLRHALAEVVGELRQYSAEPWFYPGPALHLTVATIVAPSAEYARQRAEPDPYVRCLAAALAEENAFGVHLRGVVGTPGGVVALGDYADGTLDRIRAEVAGALQRARLPVRGWPRRSAHITLARFARAAGATELVDGVERLRSRDLGVMEVAELALVESDWYMTPGRVKQLAAFALRPA